MAWFWFAVTIGFVVVELTTVQLVCVWFALSAMITAIITAIFGAYGFGIAWQISLFVILAVLLLALTRPLVKKLLSRHTEKQKTNLELFIGKEAIVTEDIDNIKGEGAIKINGIVWSARSADNTIIKKDEIVIFKEISGNKAIVEGKGD